MTKDEILELPAGTKINQLIWWKLFDMKPTPPNNDMLLLSDYSGDIVATFDLIQQLRAMNYNVRVELHKTYTTVTLWQRDMTEHGPYPITCRADTIYLAVCRVALLAVMGVV